MQQLAGRTTSKLKSKRINVDREPTRAASALPMKNVESKVVLSITAPFDVPLNRTLVPRFLITFRFLAASSYRASCLVNSTIDDG